MVKDHFAELTAGLAPRVGYVCNSGWGSIGGSVGGGGSSSNSSSSGLPPLHRVRLMAALSFVSGWRFTRRCGSLDRHGWPQEPDVEVGNGGGAAAAGAGPGFEKFRREIDAMDKAVVWVATQTTAVNNGEVPPPSIPVLLNTCKEKLAAVRRRLDRVAKENRQFAADNPNATGESKLRVNTHTGLVQRFITTAGALQSTSAAHASTASTSVASSMRALAPGAAEADVQAALGAGRAGDAAVDRLVSTADAARRVELRGQIEDLRARNADIGKLAGSLTELHAMFVDMGLLVNQQTELLNNIEANVEKTKVETVKANEELVSARAYQKKKRKKIFCIVILVIAILAAILIPVLITQLPKWTASVSEAASSVSDAFTGGGRSSSPAPSPAPSTAASPASASVRVAGGGTTGRQRWLPPAEQLDHHW
ncbi:hypothetical protein MMPV_002782 [Pyropia vietnamensis]